MFWSAKPVKSPEKHEQAFGPGPEGSAASKPGAVRQNFDEKQRLILRAATGLIARVGFEKASMRAVAQAAGVRYENILLDSPIVGH